MKAHRKSFISQKIARPLAATLILSSLSLMDCTKEPSGQSNAPASQSASMKYSIDTLVMLGKDPKKNRKLILAEEEKIGKQIKDMHPEQLIRCYRDFEKQADVSFVEMAAASLSSPESDISTGARLGSIFLVLPSLPHKLSSDDAFDVMCAQSYLDLLGNNTSFSEMKDSLGGWARGREPYSHSSLMFVFADMSNIN